MITFLIILLIALVFYIPGAILYGMTLMIPQIHNRSDNQTITMSVSVWKIALWPYHAWKFIFETVKFKADIE